MSVQHFAVERSGRELQSGRPTSESESANRVVRNAIVSNKTFGNATSAPTCKRSGTFKTFEQDRGALVSPGTMNGANTNTLLSACFSLSIRTRPLSRSVMLERIEKFKHFSLHF
jgi:hypothetical protein